jgi:hypothetical protein
MSTVAVGATSGAGAAAGVLFVTKSATCWRALYSFAMSAVGIRANWSPKPSIESNNVSMYTKNSTENNA